ncbi:scavenger receptor class F member 1-like [Ostrea edulis]|uniref:scavenger receptor class F member 1-like n=1 Tax=Ostrea edulis TaxID=37623 RepID=UPI0024AF751E|nr:scavenger receptor class F member 1-like [Ostrea edulis]
MWNTSVYLVLAITTCVRCKWCKENQNHICCSNYFLNLTTNQCQLCPDGYFDVNCSKTCYPGLYGFQCLHVCPSECKNTCHYVTGDCPDASTLTDTGSSSGYLKTSISVPMESSSGLLDDNISQQRRTNSVNGASTEFNLQGYS